MQTYHYNYVVFNVIDNKHRVDNKGYYTICTKDLEHLDNVFCVNVPLSHVPSIIRFIYNIHHSAKINNIINLPFKRFWYPFYFKNQFKDNKPLCFVCMARLPIDYLFYLKKRYPNSKFVLMYRDLRFVTESNHPIHIDNPIYDLHMTIDENEAHKYGYLHFNEFESKIDIPIADNYPLSDVFFAGKAKDRLHKLLRIYNNLTNAGLNCSFILTHVPESEKANLKGIQYFDKYIPYYDMLYHTINSRCILEINQEHAVGYTSRFLEAVMFNKKLITDNPAVLESPFYSPTRIQYIESPDDIDISFIRNMNTIDYNYNNEFSPIHVIQLIEAELTKNGK